MLYIHRLQHTFALQISMDYKVNEYISLGDEKVGMIYCGCGLQRRGVDHERLEGLAL